MFERPGPWARRSCGPSRPPAAVAAAGAFDLRVVSRGAAVAAFLRRALVTRSMARDRRSRVAAPSSLGGCARTRAKLVRLRRLFLTREKGEWRRRM